MHKSPRLLIGTAVAAVALLTACSATASSAGSQRHAATADARYGPLGAAARPPASTCSRQIRTFVGPVRVSPLTASAAQLRAEGFPPRPPRSLPGALSAWTNVMRHFKRFVRSNPVCGAKGSTRYLADLYDGLWAGYGYLAKDFGNGSDFQQVSGEWTQPAVSGNRKYANSDYRYAPQAAFWDGLGGLQWKVSSPWVIQAGCSSISTATPQYKCWTDDFKHLAVYEGPVVRPGDTVYVDVLYDGNSQASYYIENVTTGATYSVVNSANYESDNTAEWVTERPNGLYYPRYGTSKMSDNYAYSSTEGWELVNANAYNMSMTSNCEITGDDLAYPGRLSRSDFVMHFVLSSPYCNGGFS
jgi:hypothetical protein